MKPLNELTNAELSECFAVEAAGYGQPFTAVAWHDRKNKSRPLRFCAVSPVKFELGDFGAFVREDGQKLSCGQPHRSFQIPPFSTSADAVLPWLEKHLCVSITWAANGWHVVIHTETGSGDDYDMPVLGQADDAVLSRAACIALIEAKRREVK